MGSNNTGRRLNQKYASLEKQPFIRLVEQMYLPAEAHQTPARAACLVCNITFRSHSSSSCCPSPHYRRQPLTWVFGGRERRKKHNPASVHTDFVWNKLRLIVEQHDGRMALRFDVSQWVFFMTWLKLSCGSDKSRVELLPDHAENDKWWKWSLFATAGSLSPSHKPLQGLIKVCQTQELSFFFFPQAVEARQ